MTIHEAILAIMGEVHGVAKESRNQHGGYAYAGHEAVTAAIRESMRKHGVVQTISTENLQLHPGGHVTIDVLITWATYGKTREATPQECAQGLKPCESRTEIKGRIQALQHAQTKNGSPTAQQIGQALSYACKNFAFKTLMLTGDPDADSDSGPFEQEPAQNPADLIEAKRMLDGYAQCKTFEEITAHSKSIEAWGKVNSIPGLRNDLVRAAQEGKKRVRGEQ